MPPRRPLGQLSDQPVNAAYSSQAQASERVFAYRKVYDLLRTMIEKKVLCLNLLITVIDLA